MCLLTTPKQRCEFAAVLSSDAFAHYIQPMSEQPSRFRRTLVQVMTMQVVALLLLWWLQARYAN